MSPVNSTKLKLRCSVVALNCVLSTKIMFVQSATHDANLACSVSSIPELIIFFFPFLVSALVVKIMQSNLIGLLQQLVMQYCYQKWKEHAHFQECILSGEIFYGSQKLEGFVWEKDPLSSSHASSGFPYKSF